MMISKDNSFSLGILISKTLPNNSFLLSSEIITDFILEIKILIDQIFLLIFS